MAAFLTTIPKVGALIAAVRLLEVMPAGADIPLLVGVLAAVSMTLGNFPAFWQTDVRRLLGWSTVSQVGYLLLPVAVAGRSDLAVPSLVLYLAGYAVTNLTAFAVVAAFPARRSIADYTALAARRPLLAGALVVSLLGLVGTPRSVLFFGKLTTFAAAADGGLAWLVVIAAVNTVASLFCYLRWLAPMFVGGGAEGGSEPMLARRRWAARTAVTSAVATLVLGIASGLLLLLIDGPLAR